MYHPVVYHSITVSQKLSEVTLFADDTNLIQIGRSLESLSLTMTYDLSFLSTWLNANKIALNATKTELIVFRSRFRLIGEINIVFNGIKLSPSSSLKYLGVLLDEHLSWNQHISDLWCKLRRANGALSKNLSLRSNRYSSRYLSCYV